MCVQVGVVAEAELVRVIRLVAGVPKQSIEAKAAEERGSAWKPRAELEPVAVESSLPSRAAGVQRRHLPVLRRIQVVDRHRRAIDRVEHRHRRPICQADELVVVQKLVVEVAVVPGRGHRDPRQQFVLHFEAAFQVPGAPRVRVVGRQRPAAEIRRQAGEVDLASGREIDATPLALRDVVVIQIGQRERERGCSKRVVSLGS